MLAVLGVIAFFPMVISLFVAFGLFREGNSGSAIKAMGVALVCMGFVLVAPKAQKTFDGDGCERYSKFATTC